MKYCADGYYPVTEPDEDGFYTVETYNVVRIVSTGVLYDSISAAIEAATAGDTIQLIKSFSASVNYPAGKALTIDLAGYTIDLENTTMNVRGALTIEDSSVGHTGKIINNSNSWVIYKDTNDNMTINGGTFENTNTDGIGIHNHSGLTYIYGGTVITRSTSLGSYNGKFWVYGGRFSKAVNSSYVDNAAGYRPTTVADEDGFYTVEEYFEVLNVTKNVKYHKFNEGMNAASDGDTLQVLESFNTSGITVPAGKTITFDLNGNTLSGAYNVVLEVYGTAIVKDSSETQNGKITNYSTNAPITVYGGGTVYVESGIIENTISGGINNPSCILLHGGQANVTGGRFLLTKDGPDIKYTNSAAVILISGGQFTHQVPAEYCAEGCIPSETTDEDGFYYVYENYIVRNATTGTQYSSFTAAVSAAENGETLQLMTNVTEQLLVPGDKNIVLDLNGYTMNGNGGECIVVSGILTIKDTSTS